MTQSHDGHDHIWADGLTHNQELVLGALAHAPGPLSAYDLLDQLRADGLRAPLQIYRALEKLTERGLAHRLESLNAFIACGDEKCHDGGLIAFAICSACGGVEEFVADGITERLGQWAEGSGFKAGQTTIELRGRCRDCAD